MSQPEPLPAEAQHPAAGTGPPRILVAGAGIGGLAAAIACRQAGWQVDVLERADRFGEVGAGIQLGPNATRLLRAWGLADALAAVACEPAAVHVRDAASGQVLGLLPLGAQMRARYGAPYCTVHRADLHALLVQAARAAGAGLHLSCAIKNIANHADFAGVADQSESKYRADALIGADGLWSPVRQSLLADGPPGATGHVAWRATLAPADLPGGVRADEVSVWLAPRMHMVCYPVRSGSLMNLVLIAQGLGGSDVQSWSQAPDLVGLRRAAGGLHAAPTALVQAVGSWLQWALFDREPLARADQMARGRVALLGDAAHPMRPYVAQGGAMAIEDAAQLARSLVGYPLDVPAALQDYARARYQRNAQVQQHSRRNGVIFHASGPLRLARNLAIRAGGSRMLDSPWLYGP